jgi:hypothetical protein
MNFPAANWVSDPDAHFKGAKTPVSDIQNEGSVGLKRRMDGLSENNFFWANRLLNAGHCSLIE